VVNGNVPVKEFTVENVIQFDKAVWVQNSILFVFESFDQLILELKRYFEPIKAGELPELTR
jgi:hypothetical protein